MTAVVRADALRLPLRDATVDLIVTSPPYFALRSYRDDGEHYKNQIGSEETPAVFLDALWAATTEMIRVLKPTGSIWVNLGDKYAGSGGHNNSGISRHGTGSSTLQGNGRPDVERRAAMIEAIKAERRNAPDRYNQNTGGVPAKSLMGLPWRYVIGCIDHLGLILRAEMIWSKPNGLPESVTDRVRRSHEQWFHLTKQGRYFSAVDEVRETYDPKSLVRYQSTPLQELPDERRAGKGGGYLDGNRDANPLGKLPGSVWTIPSEPLVIPEAVQAHYHLPDHFAAFPQEFPRRIILGWSPSGVCTRCGDGRRPVVAKTLTNVTFSNEATILGYACACTPYTDHPPSGHSWHDHSADQTNGQTQKKTPNLGERPPRREYHLDGWTPPATRPAVILDPFGGTGTVAMVARALGRTGISIDLSNDYCRLARWRIKHSGHAAKTEQRTWADHQGVLFG